MQVIYLKLFPCFIQVKKHRALSVNKIFYSCKNHLITRRCLSLDITAARETAGGTLISMLCAITRDLQLPCSKSKMVIVSADLQTSRGHLKLLQINHFKLKKISLLKMSWRATLALSSLIWQDKHPSNAKTPTKLSIVIKAEGPSLEQEN